MKQVNTDEEFTPSFRLPPCDIDTLCGLFTAIYVQNTKLSKVEKLFHLTQKLTGEAREIISHVPLTNDGFDLAWKNLTKSYENKRMHVNEQIKIPFVVPRR